MTVIESELTIEERLERLEAETRRLHARFDEVLNSAENVLAKMQAEGIGGLLKDVLGTRKRKKNEHGESE